MILLFYKKNLKELEPRNSTSKKGNELLANKILDGFLICHSDAFFKNIILLAEKIFKIENLNLGYHEVMKYGEKMRRS